MGAKEVCRKLGWMVAAVALLAMGTVAEARAQSAAAAGQAWVVAYNAGQRGAIDVTAAPGAGLRVVLATDLKPGDAAAIMALRAGRTMFDIRLGGVGKARLWRGSGKVLAGHAYCAFAGGPHGLKLEDVTDRLLRDPSPGKVCRQVALANPAP